MSVKPAVYVSLQSLTFLIHFKRTCNYVFYKEERYQNEYTTCCVFVTSEEYYSDHYKRNHNSTNAVYLGVFIQVCTILPAEDVPF